MTSSTAYVGVAGWTVPAALAARFGSGASHLERYASRFNAVEINSSFYRSHRRSTYERWAASVPEEFRFAVKLPKAITHERRLRDCSDLIERFAGETAGLGTKRGPILIQLPPSLGFDPSAAPQFLADASDILGGPIVCEPRHATWFHEQADACLAATKVARVAADPAVVPAGSGPAGSGPAGSGPGGCRRLSYFRLHGAPRIYWSDYPAAAIDLHAATVRDLAATGGDVWTIFDNTAAGHAPANALTLIDDLA